MIDLSAIPMDAPQPRYIDFGADQEPQFGAGVAQRVDFLGGKHAIDIKTPPMPGEPDGRIWVSRLKRAKREDARLEFPQPDFDVGNPGSPLIESNVIGGESLPLVGLTPGYTIREGQWMAITHAGRNYLYSATSDVTASNDGKASVSIAPRLRSVLVVGDAVNLSAPMITGYVAGNELAWTISNAHHVGLSFSIVERA